jgi:hypothetical protein
MIEHAINFIASFYDVPGWGGLDVKGFANLMLVLFVLITLAEILMAIYDRKKESKKDEKVLLPQAKNTSSVHWGLAKFFRFKTTAKI